MHSVAVYKDTFTVLIYIVYGERNKSGVHSPLYSMLLL